MSVLGCEHCGRICPAEVDRRDCPECGRRLVAMGYEDAYRLARMRAEARAAREHALTRPRR